MSGNNTRPAGGYEPEWDWRKAGGGFRLHTDRHAGHRVFHAYDDRHLAACERGVGLGRTVEPPTEGSEFCPNCMAVVQGRMTRDEAAAIADAETDRVLARFRRERGVS